MVQFQEKGNWFKSEASGSLTMRASAGVKVRRMTETTTMMDSSRKIGAKEEMKLCTEYS
jgi:hypothetical protein